MSQLSGIYPPGVCMVLLSTGVAVGLLGGLLGVGGCILEARRGPAHRRGRRRRDVLRGALSIPALFVAPVAPVRARWSTRVPVMLLRLSFALCLCAIAVRILMRP